MIISIQRISKCLAIVSVFLLLCSIGIADEAVNTENNTQRLQVSLQGILGTRAVLSINGERELLSSGDKVGKVRLIKILPNSVLVKIDGKQKKLRMGDHTAVSLPYKERESSTVIVPPDALGMYVTVGNINSLPVSFLIDTGATTIAMNSTQAKRLGIDFRMTGQETMVGTASGVAKAYKVVLNKVTLGSISLQNIPAVVIEGGFPVQTLLGMSFLGQLDIQHEGNVMRITKKH